MTTFLIILGAVILGFVVGGFVVFLIIGAAFVRLIEEMAARR